MTIGIIGQGFVGSSLREGFKGTCVIHTYDKYLSEKSNSTIHDIVNECDIIFVCVPTLMDSETGEASIGSVESVVVDINKIAASNKTNPVIIIKSTVPPGTVDFLEEHRSPVCSVMFNPEFLTEANSVEDFKNQDRIIIGKSSTTTDRDIDLVKHIYSIAFPEVPLYITDNAIAEMVKYTANCYLAAKAAFANEIFDICGGLKINYDEVIKLAALNERPGDSRWMVSGPDDDRGFGGHCLPGTYSVLSTDGPCNLKTAYKRYASGEKMSVLSFDSTLSNMHMKNVTKVTENDFVGDLITFVTDDGSSVIECTPEHLFPMERDGVFNLLQAKHIIYSDRFYVGIMALDMNSTAGIESISNVSFSGKVYNIELETKEDADDLFWMESTTGIVTHNCLPKDVQSTRYISSQFSIQVKTTTLDAANTKNNQVRKNRDWERMKVE